MTDSPISLISPKQNYLLDTNVFVDYWRNSPTAIQVLNHVLMNNIHSGYSILTYAELWVGVKDKKSENDHKIMLKPHKLYDLNKAICAKAGYIKRTYKQTGISLSDAIIAATAEYYNLTVISTNTKHYENIKSIKSISYEK